MDGRDGRLSAAYVQEVLSLANGGADEVPAEPQGRLAPDYASPEVPVASVAAPASAGVHGRVTRGYAQAVAEFLANA
jgi:hypothetical protein